MPSVDGLASGLNTTDIVQQLMAAERKPGKRLATDRTNADAMQGALSRLNGMVKSMGDAAKALDPTSLLSPWKSNSVTSSNKDLATASASSSATAGTVSFKVTETAKAATGLTDFFLAADTFTGSPNGDGFDIMVGGTNPASQKSVHIAEGAKLEDIAKAINDIKAGVTATLIRTGGSNEAGEFKLKLTTTATGAAENVTLEDDPAKNGGLKALLLAKTGVFNPVAGKDAKIELDDGTATPVSLTSSTNTFSQVLPGVSVTVAKEDPNTKVNVTITKDMGAITDKMQAMVDAANDALSNIRINAKYDPERKLAGQFTGDATTREVMQRITSVFSGSFDATSVGMSIQRDGSIKFDKAAFAAAYAKDPAAVEASTAKVAQNLTEASNAASNSSNGILTVRIQGEQTLVRDYSKRIGDFEDKMKAREQVLMAKFQRLESMLSKLKNQGNWLAGQLGALPVNQKSK